MKICTLNLGLTLIVLTCIMAYNFFKTIKSACLICQETDKF